MSKSKYSLVFKCEAFSLSEGSDGFWLYDNKAKINLAMRAKTQFEAFKMAIDHWQEKDERQKRALATLQGKVDSFLKQFNEEYDHQGSYPHEEVEFCNTYR